MRSALAAEAEAGCMARAQAAQLGARVAELEAEGKREKEERDKVEGALRSELARTVAMLRAAKAKAEAAPLSAEAEALRSEHGLTANEARIIAGEAGTTVSSGDSGIVYATA